MARFNTASSKPAQPAGAITTTGRTVNHAGGAGFTRDTKGELYLLAVVNMVGQDAFHEPAANMAQLRKGAATPSAPWLHSQERSQAELAAAEGRDARFQRLVRTVALEDPAWLLRMTRWLRQEGNMRTACVVLAAETIRARLDAGRNEPFEVLFKGAQEAVWCGSKDFIPAAVSRGDEPGEVLGYWASRYGKKFPKPVKRGTAIALLNVMSEYGYAKYGRAEGGAWGWGDVAEMVRPDPTRVQCVGVASGDGLEGTAVRCTAKGVWLDRVSRPWCEEHYQEALEEHQAKGRDFPVVPVTRNSDLIRHAINERHGRGDAELRCRAVIHGDDVNKSAQCPKKGVWMGRWEPNHPESTGGRPLCEEHRLRTVQAEGDGPERFRADPIPDAEHIPASLTLLRKRAELLAMPQEARKGFLSAPGSVQVLSDAGITWEALSGWLGGPLDAAFWEAVIPTMGYMALLRNLRNFEQAGISVAARKSVIARLSDPAQVARSRQLPFRFLSAYKAVNGDHYRSALSDALDASVGSLPRFPGKTLVLVDTSGSMRSPISAKSTVTHLEIGALFGYALAQKALDAGDLVELYGYADGIFQESLVKGGSILRGIESFNRKVSSVGNGTQTVAALRGAYNGHDRVILVTDMQAFVDYSGGWGWPTSVPRASSAVSDAIPASVPMFGINPGGYGPTALDLSEPNRFEIGGFSDKVFQTMALLGQGESFEYPF